jgi:hypothetical protein
VAVPHAGAVAVDGIKADGVHVHATLAAHVDHGHNHPLASGRVGHAQVLAALVLGHGAQALVVTVCGPGILQQLLAAALQATREARLSAGRLPGQAVHQGQAGRLAGKAKVVEHLEARLLDFFDSKIWLNDRPAGHSTHRRQDGRKHVGAVEGGGVIVGAVVVVRGHGGARGACINRGYRS